MGFHLADSTWKIPIEEPVAEPYTEDMSLSCLIRFGTSTWAYEGWKGQIYQKLYAKSRFSRECLVEYCRYQYNNEPLFRTVGNDSTFYRPSTADQLRHYSNQVTEDFEMCFKVWEEITIPRFPTLPRYGPKAGKTNPHFLDAELFCNMVLPPYRESAFESHMGPFIFEFQRHGLPVQEFCTRLNIFFSRLPKHFRYAVEVRNAELLGPQYRDVLTQHAAAHVYNHWSWMPPLAEQHRRMGGFTAPFTVFRLLTPLKMSYEAAKRRAAPYNKIMGVLPEMRLDTVSLVTQAIAENRQGYVLVNNRSEGNAPLTIQALVKTLTGS